MISLVKTGFRRTSPTGLDSVPPVSYAACTTSVVMPCWSSLVISPDSQSGEHGFEPRTGYGTYTQGSYGFCVCIHVRIAQLAERSAHNGEAPGSIPGMDTRVQLDMPRGVCNNVPRQQNTSPLSSVEERLFYTEDVGGSNPSAGTWKQ